MKVKLICQCGCEVSIPKKSKNPLGCQFCGNDLRMPNTYEILEAKPHSFQKITALAVVAVGIGKNLV